MTLGATLFSFQGRVRRTTYWLANIGTSLVLGLLGTILVIVAAAVQAADASPGASTAGGLASLWLIPVFIAAVWIGLALAVKRCHDRGYLGVAVLIMLVPILGSLWALIDLGFIDGTPGPNRFGVSPKGVLAPPQFVQPVRA